MNPILYEEHRYGHRRMRVHFRRTLVTGLLPIGIALFMAASPDTLGPGWYSTVGLAGAGLLLLMGLRGLHTEPRLTPPARWLVQHTDGWYAALLVLLQNYFIGILVLLLWFAIADLDFPATPLQNVMLLALLILSPVRRIMDGTYTANPSPLREIVMESLRYLNASLIAVFVASTLSRIMMPPGDKFANGLPPTLVLVWLPAVLVVLGSFILLIDHILRKMPAPAPTLLKDTLD